MLRYAAIIFLLLLFGCKTGKITGHVPPPGSLVIAVAYNDASTEGRVLDILNKYTALLQYDLRHTYFFSNEIVATCSNFNNVSPDDLGK